MKLISTKFNFNSSLESIANNSPNGTDRECLIDHEDPNKEQQLINYAYSLKNIINTEIFLSVKFPYGSRPKRIEIVFFFEKFLVLSKLTNSKKLDQASLELQSLITSTKGLNNGFPIKGLVFYLNEVEKAITDKFARELVPDIRFLSIDNLSLGKLSGIFSQSSSSS